MRPSPRLEVRGLRVDLGAFAALGGVSLRVEAGECVAVVGPSGCGKSTLAAACLRLLPPGARIAAGEVLLDGEDLVRLPERALEGIRGARIAWIPQEPGISLDPLQRLG